MHECFLISHTLFKIYFGWKMPENIQAAFDAWKDLIADMVS